MSSHKDGCFKDTRKALKLDIHPKAFRQLSIDIPDNNQLQHDPLGDKLTLLNLILTDNEFNDSISHGPSHSCSSHDNNSLSQSTASHRDNYLTIPNSVHSPGLEFDSRKWPHNTSFDSLGPQSPLSLDTDEGVFTDEELDTERVSSRGSYNFAQEQDIHEEPVRPPSPNDTLRRMLTNLAPGRVPLQSRRSKNPELLGLMTVITCQQPLRHRDTDEIIRTSTATWSPKAPPRKERPPRAAPIRPQKPPQPKPSKPEPALLGGSHHVSLQPTLKTHILSKLPQWMKRNDR